VYTLPLIIQTTTERNESNGNTVVAPGIRIIKNASCCKKSILLDICNRPIRFIVHRTVSTVRELRIARLHLKKEPLKTLKQIFGKVKYRAI
jgi:hypothetical protein